MSPSEKPVSTRQPTLLSIVIPSYNECEVLPLLFQRLAPILDSLRMPVEVILVDDGSRDNSRSIMFEITNKDSRFKALLLSRNFGHQIALSAGLNYCKGDVIAVLDADLQDPPELIGPMVDKWKEGYDVVYGKRVSREGESFAKRFTAGLFYWLIQRLTDVDIPSNVGDFRVMDHKVVEALNRMPEQSRFIRGLIVWSGFKQYPFEFERPSRTFGVTKYPLKAMIRFAFDAFFSFSVIPLRVATGLGIFVMLCSTGIILRTLYMRFVDNSVIPGFTAIYVLILTLGGLGLIILGIMGEYLGRIYVEVKRRPLYLIEGIYSSEVKG